MQNAVDLSAFYETIIEDSRLGASHVSLYIALMYQQSKNNCNHFNVHRLEITRLAKISIRTYSRCMRDLQLFGYIKYEASSDARIGSKVLLNRL